jgi:hypothetical protein
MATGAAGCPVFQRGGIVPMANVEGDPSASHAGAQPA